MIHLDDDDQRRSEPALAPVPGVIQPAANPAMNVSPTETVPLTAEPTGAELGMPRESSAAPAPGPSAVQYDARRLPEDQVGAAKDAMVQVELMVGDAKGAYDSIASLYKKSLELRDDIRVSALVSVYFPLVTHLGFSDILGYSRMILQWVHYE